MNRVGRRRTLWAGVLGPLLVVACGGAGAEGHDGTGGDAPTTAAVSEGTVAADGDPPSLLGAGDDVVDVGGGRPLAPDEERALASLIRRTEAIRHLRFQRAVTVEVEDRDTITDRFLRDFDEEALDDARLAYVALGLLGSDVDLRGILADVLGEQVVGYYDAEVDRLVVREDVMGWLAGRSGQAGALDAERRDAHLVILHELVHALQDQHFDLDRFESDELASDAGLARRSLIEGDATLAILAYSLSMMQRPLSSVTRSRNALDQLLGATENAADPDGADAALAGAPPIVRGTLLAPYVDGTRFTGVLHGRRGWPGIDRAFTTPPASMEQVLHPETWFRKEDPDRVAIPDLPGLAAAGLELVDDDTLGEVELGYFFGLRDPAVERDREAAAGWGGDRLAVYRRPSGGPPAAVWFTAWDDEGEAVEAALAATQTLDAAPVDGARRDGRDQRVRRRGRAVLVLRQVPPSAQEEIVTAFDAFAEALPAPPDRPVPTEPDPRP